MTSALATRLASPLKQASRLERVFLEIADATERGSLSAALRLADSACRIAPDNPIAGVVHARLLIRCGSYAEALALLDRSELASAVATRAEALCHLGRFEEAVSHCLNLLTKYAIDCVDGLPRALALVCQLEPLRFPGWVGIESSLCLVGMAPGRSCLDLAHGGRNVSFTVPATTNGRLDHFQIPLDRASSGQVRICGEFGALLGSPLSWPPEFDCTGWVTSDDGILSGEVRMAWAPGLSGTLIVRAEDGQVHRFPLTPTARELPDTSFSIPLCVLPPGRLDVCVLLPDGTHFPLIGSPVVRVASESARPIAPRPERKEPGLAASPERIVDIVVPVFSGLEETLRCIESVLATAPPDEAELVVVNDASPDPALRDALESLAAQGRITLLVNPSNLGFPRSVNRGMQVHPKRDVVLLNSDCEVFGDWLKRLAAAAYFANDVGTATPFGEDASIATYPRESIRAQSSDEAACIDGIARRVNAERVIEIPVGVGFCLYVRRSCIEEVGLFDEISYDRGYGEENDFCLRARHLGWRHVAATNLFVRHTGGRSYGAMKRPLMSRNSRVLNARHPGYDALIARFAVENPLHDARRSIDIQRLLNCAHKVVLLVTLALPGGVKRHVEWRATALASAGHSVLLLLPDTESPGRVILRLHGLQLEDMHFELPVEEELLRTTLRNVKPERVELHHFLDVPPAALELAVNLHVSYSVYLHDHSWICPRLTLLGGNGGYCGEPPLDTCESCVRQHGSAILGFSSVAELRTRSARLLGQAERVYCATEDVRTRFKRYFPATDIAVIPWEDVTPPAPRQTPAVLGRVRVAVVGAISVQKGHQVLLECAREIAARDLALEFIVIGFTCDDDALLETGRVFVTGPYEEHEIGALLDREQCHVALFPSVTPETWCYTLSYALSYGLPVVAFDLGAVAERLRGSRLASLLLPLTASPMEINHCLLQIAREAEPICGKRPIDKRPTTAINLKRDRYRSDQAMNENSSMNDIQDAVEPSASVQMVTLPSGVYSFTIKSGAPAGSHGERLAMPALHVGLAPVVPQAQVEFLASPGTLDRWLAHAGNRVTVRISGGSARLLLTSVRKPDDQPLSISVQRLDTASTSPASEAPEPLADASGVMDTPKPTMEIIAHIRHLGDLHFGAEEVGSIASGLWIEALVVRAVDPDGEGLVEYRGITADGFETPWLTEPVLCGSRGRGTPLLGFAVRPRVGFAQRYDCSYTGRFASGRCVGPVTDGAMCCSDLAGDPLEGIEINVKPREAVLTAAPQDSLHPEIRAD
jgi:GT2 family glycosyltransferase/glycosyltransferase involved in cell wall biosynthesis